MISRSELKKTVRVFLEAKIPEVFFSADSDPAVEKAYRADPRSVTQRAEVLVGMLVDALDFLKAKEFPAGFAEKVKMDALVVMRGEGGVVRGDDAHAAARRNEFLAGAKELMSQKPLAAEEIAKLQEACTEMLGVARSEAWAILAAHDVTFSKSCIPKEIDSLTASLLVPLQNAGYDRASLGEQWRKRYVERFVADAMRVMDRYDSRLVEIGFENVYYGQYLARQLSETQIVVTDNEIKGFVRQLMVGEDGKIALSGPLQLCVFKWRTEIRKFIMADAERRKRMVDNLKNRTRAGTTSRGSEEAPRSKEDTTVTWRLQLNEGL